MDGKDAIFSKQRNGNAIHIWNHATISLLDIRHNLISPEEAVHFYRTPASTFIYTIGNRADVSLNDAFYKVKRFGLFHCSKGTELSISPMDDWLEYYMVFYKAGEPSFHRKEYLKLLEQGNPFRQQYGFMPDNPIFFADLLRKMYEGWKGPTPLTLFYGKSAFYQLVYEIYEELDKGNIHILEPDIVAMAKRYLDKRFRQTITIQEICDLFGISYSHFHRRFKQQTGKSPQEYLMDARLIAARDQLRKSNASVREIADYCGFQDERSFHRLFLKSMGITPGTYREKSPLLMRDNTIENVISFPYNEKDKVRFVELKEGGANFMIKQMKSKAIVAVALSLMLMLSACGTTSTNTGNSEPSQVVETEAQNMETGTRIVSTVMGDVEVPVNPQRIIINDYTGDLFALGVKPLAAIEYIGSSAYSDKMDNVQVVSNFEVEGIMALEPDLILYVAWPGDDDTYEDLSKIAPTIKIPTVELSLDERVTLIAQAVGKEQEAEQALADFYEKVAIAKEKLIEAGYADKTFSIFEAYAHGSIHVFGNHWGRGGYVVYSLLGLKPQERVIELIDNRDASYASLSSEVLPDYAGDYILLSQGGWGNENALDGNEIWANLPAVKNGQMVLCDGPTFFYSDLYSLEVQMNYIVDTLLDMAPNQ